MKLVFFLIFNLSLSSFQVKKFNKKPVLLEWTGESIVLQGLRPGKGLSSILFYMEENLNVDDILKIEYEVEKGPVRLRIYYRLNGKGNYYENTFTLKRKGEVELPLKGENPLWSSNYPVALLPEPQDIYIFFENGGNEPMLLRIKKMEIERRR